MLERLRRILSERKTIILREPLIRTLERRIFTEEPEFHICWLCQAPFNPDLAPYCETCGTLLCQSGHCLCHLGEEARKAVEAEITSLGMWEHTSPRRKRRRRR